MLSEPIEQRSLQAEADPATKIIRFPSAAAGQEAAGRLPRRALIYALSVFGLGIACIGFFGPQLDRTDLVGLTVFAVLAIAFGRTSIPIYGDTTVSIGMVSDFAVAFLWGPAGAVIVSPFAAMATDLLGGGAWYKRVFNIGSVVLVNLAAASVIQAAMSPIGPGLPRSGWLIPIGVAGIVVYYLTNISLVTVAVSLATRRSILAVWREKFEWLLPHYVVFGMLGLALAVGYDGLGYVGLLAFVAPPLMMRYSIKQYIDKTAENVEELNERNRALESANRDILGMANTLRETYDGTLEALVSALDARDRETRGHSVRVAKYMMEIAYHMGVEPGSEAWVDMQRGGLLHDIGKIGVSDSILHKPGSLTEAEWGDMKRHPKIGHDMIRDIGFLSGASAIVMAHHERFDGKGYPKGLTADEIPIGARIFALADAFDAMTSDRPYRAALSVDAAREEIIRCSGTQFDPPCVQAFLLAWDEIVEIRYSDHEEESEHHAAAAPRRAAA
ncbi:MAG: HD-GYP domain-containing protein [Chloroflexota bacterium]|nr:HD-GYP domain-containing protein [Chloroflexota bacterium]